jgi:hypothetical protein
MRVFISWSGDASRIVAKALASFVGECVQAAKPWMSDEIPKGQPWSDAILTQLEESQIGIVCLTKANQNSPWLIFEGGALAKHKAFHVFLIDATPAEIGPPFGMYQHTSASRDEVLKLLHTIDAKLPPEARRGEDRLRRSCEKNWAELETAIAEARAIVPSQGQPPQRSEREMLEELLTAVRDLTLKTRGDYLHGFMSELSALLSQSQAAAAEERLSDGTSPTWKTKMDAWAEHKDDEDLQLLNAYAERRSRESSEK